MGQYFHSSSSGEGFFPERASGEGGFTLLELVVSTGLGLLLLALVAGASVLNRNTFKADLVRSRTNETIRGTNDVLGADIRLGGENFPGSFPAIQLIDGGALDTLMIRRNLLSEVLPVCTALAAGTSSDIRFAIPGTIAGCTYSGQTSNFTAWKSYRTAQGGSVDAYIWDNSAKAGEFFKYTSELDGGTSYSIHRNGGTWTRAYPTGSSAVYVMEEWRFQPATGNILQLVTNQNFAAPQIVAFKIVGFDVTITLETGAVVNSFPATADWTTIKLISPNITAQERFGGKNYTRSIVGNYFPRNVLSQ